MARSNEAGFTLVEAIAALALASIAAAGLMGALSAAGVRSAETETRDAALRRAKIILADALAAPEFTTFARRGDDKDAHLAWTVAITKPGDPYPGIQQVDVDVSWTVAGKKGVTHLAGYRIAPPEAPG